MGLRLEPFVAALPARAGRRRSAVAIVVRSVLARTACRGHQPHHDHHRGCAAAIVVRVEHGRTACRGRQPPRARLRYALAGLDSLRAATVGFELEALVGRHIEQVSFPNQQPLSVRLHLDDGHHIDLLQQPAELTDGPARRAPGG
jgi:hypothetical protein